MPYPCGDDILDPHYCEDGCDIVEEHARISEGAWVHKSVYALIAADPSNINVWNTQIAAGKVILLPLLSGTFDGGTAVTSAGFGRQVERYTGSNFKATVKDPVYKKNWAHYKSLVAQSAWHFAYCTETQIHISSVPVTAKPTNPITDSTTDVVQWNAEITWFEFFTPAPHDKPDIFICVNPAIAPLITTQPQAQSVIVGNPIVLSVVATGTQPLTYQWKKDGVNIPGATSASYTKTNTQIGEGGSFTVVVTNAIGTVTSAPATVTVADLSFDTILTFEAGTTDTKESVSGTIAASDTTVEFQFNKDTTITGLPNSMSLTLGGTEVMTVDFPGDYLTHQFRYVHIDGSQHLGNFANGTVALT